MPGKCIARRNDSTTEVFYADMKALAAEHEGSDTALRTLAKDLVDTRPDERDCFCVNAIVELAPSNPELAERGRARIQRMCTLLEQLITRHGMPRPLARAL